MMIETAYGRVEGIRHNGCTAYLGIPFALPPVGELTFRHLLPPEPWRKTKKKAAQNRFCDSCFKDTMRAVFDY